MDRDGVVDVLAQTGVELADELLRASGALPPPTVFMLTKYLPEPYLGSLATRPYYRGADAAAAVADLGVLPSIARASRLVIIWEYQDLMVSLEDPRMVGSPTGLVVVDAGLFEHVVRWHPAQFRLPGEHDDPSAVILPEWGEPVAHPGGWLPAPVEQLLSTWRELRGGDVAAELTRLVENKFLVSWRSERDGVGQPVRR